MVKIGKYSNMDVCINFEKVMNNHICLIGKSGSGKTVAGQKLILEIVKSGGTIIAFDLHHVLAENQIFPEIKDEFKEYVTTCDAFKGAVPCNLFSPMVFGDGREENAEDTVGAITDVLVQAFDLKCRQKVILRKAVSYVMKKNLYSRKGFRAIKDGLLVQDCDVAENIADKLDGLFTRNVFCDGEDFWKPGKINVLKAMLTT